MYHLLLNKKQEAHGILTEESVWFAELWSPVKSFQNVVSCLSWFIDCSVISVDIYEVSLKILVAICFYCLGYSHHHLYISVLSWRKDRSSGVVNPWEAVSFHQDDQVLARISQLQYFFAVRSGANSHLFWNDLSVTCLFWFLLFLSLNLG